MTDPIEPRLARLAEPAAPYSLVPGVMARIARLTVHDPVTARRPVRTPVGAPREEWVGGLWAFIGVMLAVGAIIPGWITTGSAPNLISSRIGNAGLVLIPTDGFRSLLLWVGLLLYLRGLFAPLRRRT